MTGRPRPPQGVGKSDFVQLDEAEVGVHLGNILMDHLADKYPSLVLTLLEGVQNAIDASATKVMIFVDQRERTMFMLDNGEGVEETRFNKAIRTIGQTIKSSKKLGRYGIGVISPINKCDRFYFISKGDARGYVGWPFIATAIRQATTQLKIQPILMTEPPAIPTVLATALLGYQMTWQTMLIMEKIVEDKVIALVDLDELTERIVGSLGHRMKQNNVTCRVVIIREDGTVEERDIKPRTYTGKSLGVFELYGEKCGFVTLELYQVPLTAGKRHREGIVSVSEAVKIYPLPWPQVRQQLQPTSWVKEFKADLTPVMDALSSGIVEGLVLVDNIRIDTSRKYFHNDEPLQDLLFVLQDWYVKGGYSLFDEEQAIERDRHQRQLAGEMLEELDGWARGGGEWGDLMGVYRTNVALGRVGEGHSEVDSPVGRDEHLSTRRGRGGAGKTREASESTSRTKGEPRGPRGSYKDTPVGVLGKGTRRTMVRHDSTGLWIDVVDFTLGTQLFSFDRTKGELLFNSGNEVWSRLYGANERRRAKYHDQQIKHLMLWVIIELGTYLDLPQEQFDEVCERLNKKAPLFARGLIQFAASKKKMA